MGIADFSEAWKLPRKPLSVKIEGVPCWPLEDFAMVTRRSKNTLFFLAKYGTQFGKLKTVKIERSVFIPVEQLTAYTYVDSGRYGKMRTYVYVYDAQANTCVKKYTGLPVRRAGDGQVDG